jgi:hypothetical protein
MLTVWTGPVPLRQAQCQVPSSPPADQVDSETIPAEPQRKPFSSEEIFRPIGEIDLNAKPTPGIQPPDYSEELFVPADEAPLTGQIQRNWPVGVFEWAASELAHQPLYFDDVPLERYGQTHCRVLQPAISAARFFGTFPAIPYKMAIDHPYDRISTLGLWRPGSPTPCIHQKLPWECRAAAWEGAAWAGLILLLP